jgi:hypothetical protein
MERSLSAGYHPNSIDYENLKEHITHNCTYSGPADKRVG